MDNMNIVTDLNAENTVEYRPPRPFPWTALAVIILGIVVFFLITGCGTPRGGPVDQINQFNNYAIGFVNDSHAVTSQLLRAFEMDSEARELDDAYFTVIQTKRESDYDHYLFTLNRIRRLIP